MRHLLSLTVMLSMVLVSACGGSSPKAGAPGAEPGAPATARTPAPAAPEPAAKPATQTGASYGDDYDNGQSAQPAAQQPPAQPAPQQSAPQQPPPQQPAPQQPAPEKPADGSPKVVEIEVKLTEFAFEPKEVMLPLGATVRLALQNTGERPHDFAVHLLGLDSRVIDGGGAQVLEFVADKAGTYEIVCTQRGHKDRGMVGILHVH